MLSWKRKFKVKKLANPQIFLSTKFYFLSFRQENNNYSSKISDDLQKCFALSYTPSIYILSYNG